MRESGNGSSSVKHSIRRRIMLIFLGIMTAVLFSVWVINNWWLERYYVDEKRKEMEEAPKLERGLQATKGIFIIFEKRQNHRLY